MATPRIPRELKDLFDKYGAKIQDIRANKHFVITLLLPNGHTFRTTCAQSASDRRALANVESRLRRAANSPEETSDAL